MFLLKSVESVSWSRRELDADFVLNFLLNDEPLDHDSLPYIEKCLSMQCDYSNILILRYVNEISIYRHDKNVVKICLNIYDEIEY